MRDCPCKNCPAFAMCNIRAKEFFQDDASILSFAFKECCPLLDEYMENADQDMVNEARVCYGLEEKYKLGEIIWARKRKKKR